MNYDRAKAMIAKLMSNAAGLRYGSASVTVKLHDGRVVQVSYSTQEHTRTTGPQEQAAPNEKDE